MWTEFLRMSTTQWEPWDYSFVFLGHGILRMMCSGRCVQWMWSDFLADDYVPNGKFGIPLAYTFHMVLPNVSVFLTLAPLDVFDGKNKKQPMPTCQLAFWDKLIFFEITSHVQSSRRIICEK
jgi:hypothetical protein